MDYVKLGKEMQKEGIEWTDPSYNYFLPSTLTLLDVALRTSSGCGFPGGRVATFSGAPQSGKTLLAMRLCRQAQIMGGGAAWFDAENRFSVDLADMCKVDRTHNWLYGPPDTLEVCLAGMERAFMFHLESVAGQTKGKKTKTPVASAPFVVVLDSVAQMGNKKIATNSLEEGKQNPMSVASFWADFFRRPIIRKLQGSNCYLILINQLRKSMATPGSWAPPPAQLPGGEVHGFAHTTHLRFSSTALHKSERAGERPEAPLGNMITIKCLKNDGVPLRQVHIPYFYHYGMDDGLSLLRYLILNKYLKKEGSRYVLDGEAKYKSEWRREYYKNPELAKLIQQMAVDAYSDECYYVEREDDTQLDSLDLDDEEESGQGGGE